MPIRLISGARHLCRNQSRPAHKLHSTGQGSCETRLEMPCDSPAPLITRRVCYESLRNAAFDGATDLGALVAVPGVKGDG